MSLSTLVTLAELHHCVGLINVFEYEQRCRIAEWLYGDSSQDVDPRDTAGEERERENEGDSQSSDATVTALQSDPSDPLNPGYLRFLFNG